MDFRIRSLNYKNQAAFLSGDSQAFPNWVCGLWRAYFLRFFPIGSAGCGGRIFSDISLLFRVVLHLADFFYFSPIFLTNAVFRTDHGESLLWVCGLWRAYFLRFFPDLQPFPNWVCGLWRAYFLRFFSAIPSSPPPRRIFLFFADFLDEYHFSNWSR